MSFLTKSKDHECVYLSMNRPYDNLINLFKKNNIDPKKFFFVDTISKTIGGKTPIEKNVLYISSPHGLTEISIALSKALQSLKAKEKFLFFDSISTMLGLMTNDFTVMPLELNSCVVNRIPFCEQLCEIVEEVVVIRHGTHLKVGG